MGRRNRRGISLSPAAYDPGLVTYINAVEMIVSQWEFTLLFSQISGTVQPAPTEVEPTVEPSVKVTKNLIGRFAMSPQHAKAFLEILRQRVVAYEEQYGELPAVTTLLAGEQAASSEDSTPSRTSELPAEPTSPEEPSQGG
jgi:hypothetical protein